MKKTVRVIVLVVVINRKVIVILKLARKPVTQIIADAKSYVDGITKNPAYFPTPNPSIASLNGLVANLETAIVTAQTKAKGTIAARNAARKALELSLKALAFYVEGIANSNHPNGEAIAKAANMQLRGHTASQKQDFIINPTKVLGELMMSARAVKYKATYQYELTTDPTNPALWKTVMGSTHASARITGLVSGTHYYGRVTRTDKTGIHQVGQVMSATPK